MTLLALVLLVLAATAPLLAVLLRRRYADPTLLVAGAILRLLGLAALAAANATITAGGAAPRPWCSA